MYVCMFRMMNCEFPFAVVEWKAYFSNMLSRDFYPTNHTILNLYSGLYKERGIYIKFFSKIRETSKKVKSTQKWFQKMLMSQWVQILIQLRICELTWKKAFHSWCLCNYTKLFLIKEWGNCSVQMCKTGRDLSTQTQGCNCCQLCTDLERVNTWAILF